MHNKVVFVTTFFTLLVLFSMSVSAASDPIGCSSTGVTLSLAVYEDDGVTPVTGTVFPGDMLKYEATLQYANAPNCNYEDGVLTIETPDGVVHDVTGVSIPLVSSGNSFVSAQVDYIVDAADAAGDFLTANAIYANGTSLFDPDNDGNGVFPVGANTPIISVLGKSLEVTKTAEVTYDRTYTWSIEKTGTVDELVLAPGQVFLDVGYTVTVNQDGFADDNWAVAGVISIYNPDEINDATVEDVTDSLSGVGNIAVNCGGAFPIIIAPLDTLECSYSSDLPDGSDRVNTATVTTSGDVAGGEGSADVTFGEPTNEFDTSVTITDTYAGDLGVVSIEDQLPAVFVYTRDIGPFNNDTDCGNQWVNNTAEFVTNDNAISGSDEHNILVTVPCEQGCTLTQGYWKTHNDAFHGGAPTDDTWENIGPTKELEIFYPATVEPANTDSWYAVFWTAPKGNAYYNLAHQYMAAVLNTLNGADTTVAVDDAFVVAANFFNEYTPAEAAGMLKGKNKKNNQQLHANIIAAAGTLASYNEGDIGPGHCDEDSSSEQGFAESSEEPSNNSPGKGKNK